MEPLHEVDAKKKIRGHLVVSFKHPTPVWAKWLFRIMYGVTFSVGAWLYGTHSLTSTEKFERLLLLVVIDHFVWVIAKGLGIKKKDMALTEDNKKGK